MLQHGIVKRNSSVFSSWVILVKKKDVSWNLCVNYIEINKVIVPDKYLIPIVEELLDELHKASYFSKLYLMFGYHHDA